jgi:hypothetical protein
MGTNYPWGGRRTFSTNSHSYDFAVYDTHVQNDGVILAAALAAAVLKQSGG